MRCVRKWNELVVNDIFKLLSGTRVSSVCVQCRKTTGKRFVLLDFAKNIKHIINQNKSFIIKLRPRHCDIERPLYIWNCRYSRSWRAEQQCLWVWTEQEPFSGTLRNSRVEDEVRHQHQTSDQHIGLVEPPLMCQRRIQWRSKRESRQLLLPLSLICHQHKHYS